MPNNYRYTEGFPTCFRQRVSDMLDFHDKADRMTAIKKTFLSPTAIAVMPLIGVAGAISIPLPFLYFVTVPLVYETYGALKENYDDHLDDIKLRRMRDFDIQVVPEIAAEVEAFQAAQGTYDNERFHYPPDYVELDPLPPRYSEDDLFRADPLPGNEKETSV